MKWCPISKDLEIIQVYFKVLNYEVVGPNSGVLQFEVWMRETNHILIASKSKWHQNIISKQTLESS